MLNRKVAGMLDRETTVGTGHYSLRLPSYRSSHARRYHPYPAVRRYARNDEFYRADLSEDRISDFDYEAAEHVLMLPPSLQLRPVQRSEDGNDDDVKAFALDGSASKDVQVKRNKEVMVAEEEEVSDDTPAKSSAVTRPSAKLTLLYALLVVIHYVRDRLIKDKVKSLKEVLLK